MQRNQPQVDLHVRAGDTEQTWKQINNLIQGVRLEVWMTTSTMKGESRPSARISIHPTPTPSTAPIALTGRRLWSVAENSGVTLGCQPHGTPKPTITWRKDLQTISANDINQLLPGGDLHIRSLKSSGNYTCTVHNSLGSDSVTHVIFVNKPPSAPILRLNYATHDSLNLTIISAEESQEPILSYKIHHKSGHGGEWKEVTEVPSGRRSTETVLRNIACGSSHHVYVTAINSAGTSTSSNLLISSTQGAGPRYPDKSQLLEVNNTCIIIRPYTWPEHGCPITHWKIEENVGNSAWSLVHSFVPLSTMDINICEFQGKQLWYLLKITAVSMAGESSVVYKINLNMHKNGAITIGLIEEILNSASSVSVSAWLDVHLIAGVVSAVFMTIACIICIGVAIHKRRFLNYRNNAKKSSCSKVEAENARNSELTQARLYSPTSMRKSRASFGSIKTLSESKDSYEICPYATCGGGTIEDSLIYGLSLHDQPSSRDLMDHPPMLDLDESTYGEHPSNSSHFKKRVEKVNGDETKRNSIYKCKDDSSSKLTHDSQYNQLNQSENPLYQEHKPQKKNQECSPHDTDAQNSPRTSTRSQSIISSPAVIHALNTPSAFTNRKELAECDRELMSFKQAHDDRLRQESKSAFSSKGFHKKQDSDVGVKGTSHQIHNKNIPKPHRRMQSNPESEKLYMQLYGFQQKQKRADEEESSYGKSSFTIHV